MAALLIALSVMAILWTMAVPKWQTLVRREKEAELIFRAGQYAHAIALYQRRYANAFPPSIDILVQQKFLRKKYKDPITGGDFRVLSPMELQGLPGFGPQTGPAGSIGVGGMGPGARQPGQGSPGPGGAGQSGFGQSSFGQSGFGQTGPPGSQPPVPPASGTDAAGSSGQGRFGFGSSAQGVERTSPSGPLGSTGREVSAGGVAAVVSRSSAKSIRIFKNRQQYNQWIVTVEDVTRRVGATPTQPGQPGQQPGTPGTPGIPTSPGGTRPSGFPSPRGPGV